MTEAVKVAVRVRPFNQRENDRGATLIIDMTDKLTQITDPNKPGQPPKEFSFDYSYWSHDDFHTDENGIFTADTAKYACQRRVFDDLGRGVLDNALKGFNCSLFAYGQTGSGKSYSMVGYGPNKGIVPITCDELFKIIEGSKNEVKYQISFSMLEIYNEQVRDLLRKDNPKGGLPVRQNPKLGAFYVQGLKCVAVGSYKEIEKRTIEGTANRTVACTQMNATSSRAHTVVTIQFDQIEKNSIGQDTKRSSVINLVDLAGSERADSTGATGDRLKEGANINKSLSALGNVISALADESTGKKKILVPYRDSVLTKLLQNALGGNSKTIMIAALSPADINHDETLSTLRYADRAKKIKNKAIVNENPIEKLIRELREENERLKKLVEGGDLSSMSPHHGGGNAPITDDEKAELRKQLEEEIRAQLLANTSAMMNWDERLELARTEIVESDSTEDQIQNTPHLANLNEDTMLSGVILHFFKEGETRIGRKETNPDIAMTGLSISSEHAVIIRKHNHVIIKPGTVDSKTSVNGIPLTDEKVLTHHDRILFGSNHMYYFVNPLNRDKSNETPDTIDWEFANKEIAKAKGLFAGRTFGLSKDQIIIQEQILEILPMVREANGISEELDKKMYFETILLPRVKKETGTKLVVRMRNMMNNNVWLWDRSKFINRRFLMQDLYQRFIEGEEVECIKREDDPFWEPLEDVIIGSANVFLQHLAYAIDFDDKLTVTDYKGSVEGTISINVTPCKENGEGWDDDYYIEDPIDLLGKDYHFKITIIDAAVQKERYHHGLYIRIQCHGDEVATVTPTITGTLAPVFKFTKMFSYPLITDYHLEWFDQGYITLYLHGKQNDEVREERLLNMNTKELRKEELLNTNSIVKVNIQPIYQNERGADISRLETELDQYKEKYNRQLRKQKRIQDVVTEWDKNPKKDIDEYHRAMRNVVFDEE